MFINDCPYVIYNMHLDFDIALVYKSYEQNLGLYYYHSNAP